MARARTGLKFGKTRKPVAGAETVGLRPGLTFPVVAVGASAGGLAAFTELLKALPAKSGMAFVLIQHLEPKHESALTALLSKTTSMPVVEVSDGMAVEPNCVYVIPPNKNMTIRAGTLRLAPRTDSSGLQRPIDDFSVALADEQGDAAIGVVLSGTGSDGTYGLRAIKAAGGVTFAQDPKSAQWPAMPESAITAGSVDFILTPKRIAAELTRVSRYPYLAEAQEAPEGSDLDKVCVILRSTVGIDFRLYKQATVRRRIGRRMALRKIVSLSKYGQLLRQDPEEAHALADDIFIHVTGFFRDPECFEALRKMVLATLGSKKPADDPVRIWVAGCSTGEEVYSIAMLLLEELGERSSRTKIQIFGTDIQERAVERARAAVYTEEAVARVSPARLKRFFVKSDHGYQITKAIRDLCVFARHNLAKDPPFSRLDLISCRNVLIYMGSALQKRILSVFQYALKPDGYLFLGNSESISDYSEAFSVADQKHRIFVRKAGPAGYRDFRSATDFSQDPHAPIATAAAPSLATDFRKDAEATLLDRYAPPAIVVDADLHIVHFQGDISPFLAPPTGQPSFHVLKMVRPELVVDLRTAIYKARREGIAVRRDEVRFEDQGRPAAVRLEVRPLAQRNGKKQDLLVVFQKLDSARIEDARKSGQAGGKKEASERSERLHRELAATRDQLRGLIAEHETAQEEMKAVNEEILSSNEELQSTNEELETAKEELQSANEELVTLNDELQHHNDELTILTNDLGNLLVGVDIPVLVLDAALRVRRFTPVAGALLNLIPGDVGRPFSDLASSLNVGDWGEIFAPVLRDGELIEREVRDRTDHRYALRVRPYKTAGNQIEGVLVVLLDVDVIYRARDEAQKSGDFARAIVETIHEALVVVDSGYRVLSVNRSFCELFRVSAKDAVGKPLTELGDTLNGALSGAKGESRSDAAGPGDATGAGDAAGGAPGDAVRGGRWSLPGLRDLLQDARQRNVDIKDFEVEQEIPGMGRRHLVFNASKVETSGTILIAIQDITERKQAQEQELRILRAFVERAPAGLLMLDRRMRSIQVSQRWLDDVGLTREQMLGRSLYECLPNLSERWKELHRRGLAGESLSGQEERFVAPNGTEHWFNWQISPWGDAGGSTGGILVSTDDVTERKRAAEEGQRSAATIRSLLESAPQSVIAVNSSEIIVLVNGNTERMFGYKREELLGQRLNTLIPEGLRSRPSEHHKGYLADMQSRSMGIGLSLQARRKDGSIFPVEIAVSMIETAAGTLDVVFASDITERNEMEQAAQLHARQVNALAASLLTAQEEERRRVSRELHDQICQQLASLAIDIGGLAADPPPRADAQRQLKDLQTRVVKASEETRHIAYELHSSILDDLGLEASLRDQCHQFSARNPDIALKFTAGSLPAAVPREVASCVNRVVQESLQNIAKHARAKRVTVALGWRKGKLVLEVADDGSGFNPQTGKGQGGLGLIGMEERARLVGAKLSIHTSAGHTKSGQPDAGQAKAGRGTRIALIIPWSAEP